MEYTGARARLKALVLDMDGTLLDTFPLCVEAWRRAGMIYGIDVSADFVRGFFGMAMSFTKEMFLRAYGADAPFDSIRRERMRIGREIVESSGVSAKRGAEALLSRAGELGIKNVLATGTGREFAEMQMERAGLLRYIDASLTGESVERGKPEPDIFIKAMASVDASPCDSLVVEDSAPGVRAGAASGARVVLIPDAVEIDGATMASAWRVLGSLDELIPIVEELAR